MSLRHKLRDLDLSDFRLGMRVLDVGCGYGRELQRLADRGCTPVGLDPFPACVERCRAAGFEAQQGFAESLPFADGSFDGVISQVALPYTDDGRTFREIARVLKPGGACCLSTHGAGYYWLILSQSRTLKRASYALRCLANTWFRRLCGGRLPGTFGDTVYQSSNVLKRLAGDAGLDVAEVNAAHRFCGMPVFVYSTFRKPTTEPVPLEEQLLKEARALSAAVQISEADHSPRGVAPTLEHVG